MARILHILHTNDLHSQFASMPQIATCLRELRQRWELQGEQVLTVDIGDHLDRMSTKTEATWGKTNVEVLNRSGYQYVTIGNNEGLTLPKEKLDELYTDAQFTVILNNLHEPGDKQPGWAVPYAIHDFADLKVALLGTTVSFAPFYQLLGWQAEEPFAILAQQIAALRDQVDVMIVLSHLGLRSDREMAERIPGIDLILGAHTHHLLQQGERIGETLIAQAGRSGEYVGHVTLHIDDNGKLSSAAQVLRSADFQPDPQMVQYLEQEHLRADQLLAAEVAVLPFALKVDWRRETPFGSFLAACLRHWTKAEIGLANGGLLLQDLGPGSVTRKDLLTCAPHPINPCTVKLTGEQLWRVLNQAILPDTVNKELRGFGFRGKINGWMGIDGLHVKYVLQPEPAIVEVRVGEELLRKDRIYRVATVDMYLMNMLFPELMGASEPQFFLPEVLREILAVCLQDGAMLSGCFTPRWELASSG
ncbi:bifunctional metallophosphatase/5'-nucleotidase [Brevibacillus migulae]|uniref:bifunctional metallophosphatase/5'-nucleotidase n=1 Tax=Brevibacillus migulae TaxID=1644114 RepID=UPI001F36EF99|nr:bifunctional UDP-sugar hydrolase/5'-nucleotidase [Brevibacillus migulae]